MIKHLPKHWRYIPGAFFVFVGLFIILFWDTTFLHWMLTIAMLATGTWLCFWGYKQGQKEEEESFSNRIADTSDRTTYTGGGTYNESVQGDSITIQGNQIYINQDLSHFTAQIEKVLEQLQDRGYSRETAEQQVTNDLRAYTYRNPRIKKKLLQWSQSIKGSNENPLDTNEAVERVVKVVSEYSMNSVYESILVVGGKYEKLYNLLREGKWREADEETVKVILDLMPEPSQEYIDVEQISPKDLIKLNQLWVKCSNGRFGFSTQQSIWKKVLKVYNKSEDWIDEDAYYAFIDCVGWTRKEDRIYHGDFNYSLSAPRGHLPAKLMLDLCNYYLYSSNYCQLNTGLFTDFMEQEYYKNSFIPSWLKRWITIE